MTIHLTREEILTILNALEALCERELKSGLELNNELFSKRAALIEKLWDKLER